LRDRRIRVKWNNPEMSWLEGVFSRGDRRLLPGLLEAWSKGARFDAWSEHFRDDLWREAFESSGLDPAFYLHRKRDPEEILPWDHLDSGVKKDYHRRERERADLGLFTPDCRSKCLECGVCDHREVDPVISSKTDEPSPIPDPAPSSPAEEQVYLLSYTKLCTAAFLSHLETVKIFSRALRRAELLPAHTHGFHPTPKLSFISALPVGTESLCECVRISLLQPPSPSEVRDRLNKELPPGLEITSAEDITGKKAPGSLLETSYQITLHQAAVPREALNAFLASGRHLVVKNTKKGDRTVDARAMVKALRPLSEDTLEMHLIHPPGPSLKPSEILQEILGLDPVRITRSKILKTNQVLG
ncbi:MAG: TIGR03936 family radical SAM-associated protein, partial [Desulfobacteraceae bacterium]